MKCPNDYCGGVLEVRDTDFFSEYYCVDGCGYEERVVWPVPVKRKRLRFNEPTPPRRVPPKKKDRG